MNLDIKPDWVPTPLIAVATLQRGYDLPTNKRKAGAHTVYAANGPHGKHSEGKIKGPGVITGRSGTIGKVHFTEEDFWPLNTALYVKNFHGNDPKWVYYMLKNFRLERFAQGAGVPTLNRNLVHDIKIPLPPLPEQKRIAAILDKADAIRRKRQQAIKLADEFLRATFLDMFGDPKAKNPKTQPVELGKIAQIVMGQSPKGDSYNTNGIGVPLLNGPAEFGIKYPKERQWTTEPKKYSRPGDIFFCVRGATAGRLNWADKEYCIGRGLAAIRSKGKISNEFIYKFLEFMYQRFQESSDGSTFINIPSNILNTLPVPDPRKTEEKQFTSFAKAVEILKNRNETSFKDAENCFNSLTQRAFRGEL